nr:reverse transcriptase domain-containing protein [Tanacetum cinerariifolium]
HDLCELVIAEVRSAITDDGTRVPSLAKIFFKNLQTTQASLVGSTFASTHFDKLSTATKMYLPQIRKELKICEAKTDKSLIDEPPEVKLKDLPPHLEYIFLESDDKLAVIIAKDLSVEEKAALIKVLKSHKQSIACQRQGKILQQDEMP